jgi:serine/threonine protein kinase
VIEHAVRTKTATGGSFSIGYRVVNGDGREAFMKALDIAEALRGERDLVVELKAFIDAAAFERDLLNECRGRRLTRVIHLLDYVEVTVSEAGPIGRVPCFIFEPADGDIHQHQAKLQAFDLAWVLRTLKHVAVAIGQLHRIHATHQDIKPSNVLTQNNGREMKLGDLGRAERRGVDGPTSALEIPGAIAYAPPEQLYGAFDRLWESRRAADMYHLGSLNVQLFLGHTLTILMQRELPAAFRVGTWSGDFQRVLPYLQASHAKVVADFEVATGERASASLTADLVRAVREMTAPDPAQRGHPLDRKAKTSSYDVQRYISLYNRLAAQAEAALLGSKRAATP